MAAVRRVEDLSTDPNFIGYYDKEEAIQQDLDDMWETGYDEGIKNEKIEIAKNLIKKLDIKEVSEITGLSIDEIKKLNC